MNNAIYIPGEYDKDFFDEYGIFIKPTAYTLSSRKIEAYKDFAYMQKYFQCNPLQLIDVFFNIELLDLQALAIQRTWFCKNSLLVASRGIGKSTIVDLEIMAKQLCYNNYWCYIASGSGSQAEQTFITLERLCNDNIDTFAGSTGRFFKSEIEVKNAAGDGFSHSSNGFTYSVYNGGMTQTLNSNIDKKRGMRGSIVFDEGGWLSEEMYVTYGAFAAVNRSLRTGKDEFGKSLDPIRQRVFPTDIPNQKIYISSASSIDTPFYGYYKDFAKRQLIGDSDYCVMHLDCELAFKPTIRGELVAPLLSRETVENEMRKNPERGRREYFCIFTRDGGENSIIRRGAITRNEKTYRPELSNATGDRKIVIAYDPARTRDNSVILVGEIYEDKDINGNVEYKCRLLNCINLIDIGKKRKSPMQTPDQVAYLKEVILDYNEGGDENYSNILGIYIDAGSGGGGVNIADYLMEDWIGKDGKMHRGLIDKEYSKDYVKRFPGAIDKVHLMTPTKYKSDMYEAMIEMINQNKITFTSSYDNKGYITVFDIDNDKLEAEKEKIAKKLRGKKLSIDEYEDRMNEELNKLQNVKTKNIRLDWAEEIALGGIDALKEEVVNTVRIKRESGKDSFELAPEKRNSLNDDRAYCLAMISYALQSERRKNITTKRKSTTQDSAIDFVDSLPVKQGWKRGR